MRIFSVWALELVKLVGRRRLHPLNAECPICHQMVRLHYNKAGRRHLLAHARALYEGARYGVHYHAKVRCAASDARTAFNPRRKRSNVSSRRTVYAKNKRRRCYAVARIGWNTA